VSRRKPRGRNVQGILLLDKPVGLTSNAALQIVKRLFMARKAGHTGNLDPMASGMLPICLGEATKMSGFLLNADKRYRATFKLGEVTNTGDAEGEVLDRRPVPSLDRAAVEGAMARFIGDIDQVPPMHSAIKRQGQPLYALAHQGLEVEREPRRVTIYSFELLALADDALEVAIHCSKGTYVRTLAEDLGAALGCGAHVSALRRLTVGPFADPQAMVDMATVEAKAEQGQAALDALLLPMQAALDQYPAVNLTPDMAFYVRQGQAVVVPRAPTEGYVRLFESGERFVGVGQVMDDGRIGPKRLVNAA
jgi:tRNA pseudouridine55 synthase